MTDHEKALVLILAVALGIFPIRAAHSTNWYIGNGDAATLQQTIDNAQNGDTIIVGPGTYKIFRGFMVAKPLHIISEKGPTVTTIANFGYCVGVGGPCYASYGFYVYNFEGDFTIKGFTMRDHIFDDLGIGGWGVFMLQVSGTISDNVFIHNWGQGIYVGGSSGVHIENNLIQSNGLDGILLASNASGEIRFNTLVQNGIGLGGIGTVNAVVRNNILAQCYRGITIFGDSVTLSLSCNDIWNSVAGDCPGLPSGCIGFDGNISLDPLFCNGYYLHQESPCLAANTPSLCSGEHMGCYPVPCEVAVEKQSWGKVKAIFR